MPNTVGDHWRMIWDLKLTVVVMLTKVTEAGKVSAVSVAIGTCIEIVSCCALHAEKV